jgi:FAD/FMN-containing dehydrogenase
MLGSYFSGDYLNNQKKHPKNPMVKNCVHTLRTSILKIFESHNSVHMQLGRFYPFVQNQNQQSLRLLSKLKVELDPTGIMNPGALGL